MGHSRYSSIARHQTQYGDKSSKAANATILYMNSARNYKPNTLYIKTQVLSRWYSNSFRLLFGEFLHKSRFLFAFLHGFNKKAQTNSFTVGLRSIFYIFLSLAKLAISFFVPTLSKAISYRVSAPTIFAESISPSPKVMCKTLSPSQNSSLLPIGGGLWRTGRLTVILS